LGKNNFDPAYRFNPCLNKKEGMRLTLTQSLRLQGRLSIPFFLQQDLRNI